MDNLLMQWTEPGPARPMVDDGTSPKSDGCVPADGVLYLAGSGITDAGGSWSLVVRDALCPGVQLGLVQRVSMVATSTFNPFIDSLQPPSIVSTAWNATGGNVTLHVRTHDCGCTPSPETRFDYHAAIAYVFVT
jgi:hypothetical protein